MDLVDPNNKFGTCFYKRNVLKKGGALKCCGASKAEVSQVHGYCALLSKETNRIACSQCQQFKKN